MPDFVNYVAFIQLAVAFDFACVAFGDTKEHIYKKIESFLDGWKKNIDLRRSIITSVIDKGYENIVLPEESLPSYIKFIKSLSKCRDKFTLIKDTRLLYLGHVALISGIYSIIALLLLPELHKYPQLQDIYVYLTELTFILIMLYVCAECKGTLQKNDSIPPDSYASALMCILFAIIVSIVCGLFDIKFYTFTSPYFSLNHILHYSLLIPYIPFIGILLWFSHISFRLYFTSLNVKIITGRYKFNKYIRILKRKVLKKPAVTNKYENIEISTEKVPTNNFSAEGIINNNKLTDIHIESGRLSIFQYSEAPILPFQKKAIYVNFIRFRHKSIFRGQKNIDLEIRKGNPQRRNIQGRKK